MKITTEVYLDIDHGFLYDACYDAWNHAESGQYDTGSNYWMTMFTDKLQELLNSKLSITASNVD